MELKIYKDISFHHFGYVVNSIKNDSKFFEPLINYKNKIIDFKDYEQNVNVCFYKSLNQGYIELIEPMNKKSPVNKFLEKNIRGGLHHICYEAKNLQNAINHFTKNNFIKVTSIKKGFENRDIVFLLSRKKVELLIELVSHN